LEFRFSDNRDEFNLKFIRCSQILTLALKLLITAGDTFNIDFLTLKFTAFGVFKIGLSPMLLPELPALPGV